MSLADQSVYPSQPLDRHGCPRQELDPGMTLLQHYAGLAMQGIIGTLNGPIVFDEGNCTYSAIANASAGIARALIAELEKEQSK